MAVERTVDPRIQMPLVDGYEYDDRFSNVDSGLAGRNDAEPTFPPGSGELQPPSSMRVVEYNYRTGPDGKTVADVIIDVADVPGAMEYDVRISG